MPLLTILPHFISVELQFPFRGLSDCEETPSFEFAAQPQCSQAVRRLVSGLLTREPNQRIRSLRQLERHAFYHHFDFEVLRSKKVSRTLCLSHRPRNSSARVFFFFADSAGTGGPFAAVGQAAPAAPTFLRRGQ